jgi:hypothetical protein
MSTYVTPNRGAEAQAFLDANADIESIQIVWTDLCGVARGKVSAPRRGGARLE